MSDRMATPIEFLKAALEQVRQEVRDLELAINYLLEISADFQPAEQVVGGDDDPVHVVTSDTLDSALAKISPDLLAGTGGPSDEYVECDDCGESFHRNGIGPHRRKHRREEPVGAVARFDPDAARAAAAAAT